MTRRVAAIIPARYGSTRLPGKPLLRETGRYLVQHVVERVQEARRIDQVVVATDDERIVAAVESFGGEAVMTSGGHASGTDRVAEVARSIDAVAILNVQGDEPEIDPADLDRLAEAVLEPEAEIVTLAAPIADAATFADPNAVKVVIGEGGRALYFSRAPIPWRDGADLSHAHKHVGVYAYAREALLRFAGLPPAPAERLERLEQLRALCHGMKIRVLACEREPVGVDTEEDYRRFVERWRGKAAETA